jgi:hypothetical protein
MISKDHNLLIYFCVFYFLFTVLSPYYIPQKMYEEWGRKGRCSNSLEDLAASQISFLYYSDIKKISSANISE